jgi:hypothetical protein
MDSSCEGDKGLLTVISFLHSVSEYMEQSVPEVPSPDTCRLLGWS